MSRHVLFYICCILCAACSGKGGVPSGPGAKPLLVVSILPQTYFAGRIAGDRVRFMALAGEGQNPHSYEPGPKQMAELAGAGAWVLSGAEFELGLEPKIRALFPGLSIVNGVEGIRFRPLDVHDGDEHADTSAGDRHSWLGREPAKIMAGHIQDALAAIDPAGAEGYAANRAALIRDIDDAFDVLGGELAPLRGRTVFVYHPGFGYFLDEFGIIQEAVETGGKEPSPRLLGELVERVRREEAAAIFVQAQFPITSAKAIADATGAELVALDPLSASWLDNIMVMGRALQRAAGQGAYRPGGTEP